MTKVKAGDTVRIHYTGTLDDGTVFDSSDGREPLEFTVGSGEIIPGLDTAIAGLEVGQTSTVEVPATEAYGPHDPQGLQEVARAAVPEHIPLEIGTPLAMKTPEGESVAVRVAQVSADVVVLDANHPLAGRDLTFEVKVLEIV